MAEDRVRQRRVVALTGAGALGAFAVIPHLLEHLAHFVGTGALVAVAAGAGAWFAPRAGLTTAIIDAALTGQPFAARARSVAPLAIGLGLVAALAIVVLDVIVFAPPVPLTRSVADRPLWTGALAALYGGFTEEILLRYGLMSCLAWLLKKSVRGPGAYWAAIFVAAVVFGLMHLPPTAALLPLTPVVVARTIVVNGLAGTLFGWLYWRRGLEAAIVAHAVAAAVLHVAVPAIGM